MATASDNKMPTVSIHIDTETMDLQPTGVILQIAMFGLNLETEEIMDDPLHIYLPIQAQLDMIPARTISADTLFFWMMQPEDLRRSFERNTSDSFEELPVLMRQFTRRFDKLTNNGEWPYEVVCARPQFDLPIINLLLRSLGMVAPWDYQTVVDLRTLMREAGVDKNELPTPEGFVKHMANWDVRYQIIQYLETRRRLRARG